MDDFSNRVARHAGSIVPAILFLILLALLFSGKQNWGVPPPPRVWTKLLIPSDRAFIGAIESNLVAQAGTYLPVSGWAAPTSPAVRVARVELYLNRALVASVTDFGVRSDIAAASGRSDFEWSGWRSLISTKDLKPGDYELTLRSIGSDGSSEIIVAKKLTIVK